MQMKWKLEKLRFRRTLDEGHQQRSSARARSTCNLPGGDGWSTAPYSFRNSQISRQSEAIWARSSQTHKALESHSPYRQEEWRRHPRPRCSRRRSDRTRVNRRSQQYVCLWRNSETIATTFLHTLDDFSLGLGQIVFNAIHNTLSFHHLLVYAASEGGAFSVGGKRVFKRGNDGHGVISGQERSRQGYNGFIQVRYSVTRVFQYALAGHISISANQRWLVWTWSNAMFRSMLIG